MPLVILATLAFFNVELDLDLSGGLENQRGRDCVALGQTL
jgi:hypothetical protein